MPLLKRISPPGWAILAMLALTLVIALSSRAPQPAPAPAATTPPGLDLTARIENLTAALAAEPNDAAAHFSLGLLLALDQPEQATAHLRRAAELDSAYQGASQSVRSALAQVTLQTDPAYAAILIGQALAAQGEWPAAEAAFQRSADLAPDYAEAWAFLAEARQQNGQDGYPALQNALAANPASLAANLYAALYWRRQNDPGRAIVYLETAAALDPDNPAIQADIGQTLVALGEVQTALEHFARVTELAPGDPNSWRLLALYSIENDVQVEQFGLPAARQHLLMLGEDPGALTLMARAYSLLADSFNAEKFFQRALTAGPEHAETRLYLGLFRITQGRMEDARAALEQAQSLGADTPIAEQAAEYLAFYFP
ncbi:MAG: tetratricopeptide repeat protein [Chloroflexi bacterium]|nr:tetratricopeptide repeat protein [Chloroflexota bacterium]